MNDDAISYLDDIQTTVKALNAFREIPVEVNFPLSKWKKETIISALPSDLYKHITYCEGGQKRDKCGKCLPCIRHKALQKKSK